MSIIYPALFIITWMISVLDSPLNPILVTNIQSKPVILNAGFVVTDRVYNSELTAPYDVFQHTIYRDSLNYIRCFTVNQDGNTFITSEGLRITPEYSFDNAPPIDIIIIPSSENSMTTDLKDSTFIKWLKIAIDRASFVIAVCDGAFPLAATDMLNGRSATTFPADRKNLAEMFPEINVNDEVNFVVDGKFITSVGGILSFEPALYLVEKLYSKKNAQRIGEGLVIDWDLSKIPHLIVDH